MTVAIRKNPISKHRQLYYPQFDRFFDDLFLGSRPSERSGLLQTSSTPLTNIHVDGDQVKLEMALPGLSKKDIEIKIEDGRLYIKGIGKRQKEDLNYRLKEFDYDKIERSFSLSEDIDQENIKARFRQGILELILSKKEASKPKNIEIK